MASSTIPPPRAARKDPLVDTVINGKYRVVSLVASGGMGKIYRGEQLALGRDVALKVLHAHSAALLDDPNFEKRFFLEASILSRLQHPNIVTLFDYGAIEGGTDDRYFMAMEYLAGETLMRRVYERVSLTPKETVRIGKQIARGLSEAHAHGIVHRDLKPSNVMLVFGRDGSETVKVLDFGIVKVLGEDEALSNQELTQEGSFIGSPKYMAPEQITRGARVDARTDIYSLGIILYQCLSGTVPFEARSSIETMMAHLNDEAPPLGERAHAKGAEVPEWLEQLVMACIEKDPDRRPATMELVARVLEAAEPTLSTSGNFKIDAQNIGLGSDPFETARFVTSLRPPSLREGALREGALREGASRDGAMREGSGRPSGTARSARPSGSGYLRTPSGNPYGPPTITETGTAIGSLPPKENVDTGTHPRRLRMTPLTVTSALLLGIVAIYGVRTIRGAMPVHANDRDGALDDDSRVTRPAKATFRLVIESTPPGADVFDGADVLGATPLSLAIDNVRARTTPRKLVLKHAGYEPYAIIQGPSEENVRLLATLTATMPPAEASALPASSGSAPPAPLLLTPKTPPLARTEHAQSGHAPEHVPEHVGGDAGNMDIRMTR